MYNIFGKSLYTINFPKTLKTDFVTILLVRGF